MRPDRGIEILDGLRAAGRIGDEDWLRLRAQWQARDACRHGDARRLGSPLSDAEYASLRFVCELSDSLFREAPMLLGGLAARSDARRLLECHEAAVLARHRRVLAALRPGDDG